jgi:hypothetical protein
MGLLDNSAILNNPAFQQDLILKRNAPGAFDDSTGAFVPGTAADDVTIKGSVQPVGEKDMQRLREAAEGGAMIKDAIRIYTKTELNPGVLGAATSTQGDVIEFRGLLWTVVRSPNFIEHGHNKVFGVRTDGQDG